MSDAKVELLPAENLALTVACAQLERGENPPINTTAVLALALERLLKDGGQLSDQEGPDA